MEVGDAQIAPGADPVQLRLQQLGHLEQVPQGRKMPDLHSKRTEISAAFLHLAHWPAFSRPCLIHPWHLTYCDRSVPYGAPASLAICTSAATCSRSMSQWKVVSGCRSLLFPIMWVNGMSR